MCFSFSRFHKYYSKGRVGETRPRQDRRTRSVETRDSRISTNIMIMSRSIPLKFYVNIAESPFFLSDMQSFALFFNILAITTTIPLCLGADAAIFPDARTSSFLDDALFSNSFVASPSDDESSRYLHPFQPTDQSDALVGNDINLSINTSDECSSYYSQLSSKRMRRWDCGPDTPPFCCPKPGATPQKQAPASSNQREYNSENQSPAPVNNPLDNKTPFVEANEEICPPDIFGLSVVPVCDSGDPSLATRNPQKKTWTVQNCYPCMLKSLSSLHGFWPLVLKELNH